MDMFNITTTDGRKVSFEPYVLYARNEKEYPKRDFIILSNIRIKTSNIEQQAFVRFAGFVLSGQLYPRIYPLFISKENVRYFSNFHKASIKEFSEWKRLFNENKLDFDSDAYVNLRIDDYLTDIHKGKITWEKVGKNDRKDR